MSLVIDIEVPDAVLGSALLLPPTGRSLERAEQLRAEIQQLTDEYLARGGQITVLECGDSAYNDVKFNPRFVYKRAD